MSECANPLLLSFVSEWLETARERNSKGVTVYKKAYNSLKSCPLEFQHPSEAQQLHGFGPKLCERLTEELAAHCRENGLPMPVRTKKKKSTVKQVAIEEKETVAPAKKTKKPKPYVPTLRSGPYAIILALSTLDKETRSGLTKSETIELAQPHCDSSFSAPSDPTKFYTAWNSIKTLLDKDLVYEKGRPIRKYSLTEEGWEVAERIKKTVEHSQRVLGGFDSKDKDNEDSDFLEIISSPVRPTPSQRPNSTVLEEILPNIPVGGIVSDEASLPIFSPIILPPSSFTVQLVLDVREIRAKEDRTYMSEELTRRGVKPVMRALELGDALWVAKCKDPKILTQKGVEGDEVVLDWIIERKRLDDLIGSIKDGRFHEQKFRLRKSGVKNVIYIIEEISMNDDHFQKYAEAVDSAIASTQVVNNYFVKKTQKIDDTIRYLARMTALLKSIYESKPLRIIPTKVLTTQNYLPLLAHVREKEPSVGFNITYPAFASLASKSETMTLREIFLKMLMCTKGVTGEKALEIQRRWKTPHEFTKAFDACGPGEDGKKRKRGLVEDKMGNLVGRRKIAKTLSQNIAEIWGDA